MELGHGQRWTGAPRVASGGAWLARRVVEALGGRFSTELGIDLDGGPAEVERWFLAATLFGTRIAATVAERTYRVLSDAGVQTIADASDRTWDKLVGLLDAGGYARYDFRTATRLHDLARALEEHHGGRVASFAEASDPRLLEAALDALPGWGPTTVRIFLRELRGVWAGADPPIDGRALRAAAHLSLLAPDTSARAGTTLADVVRSWCGPP
jgi:endonuclease III